MPWSFSKLIEQHEMDGRQRLQKAVFYLYVNDKCRQHHGSKTRQQPADPRICNTPVTYRWGLVMPGTEPSLAAIMDAPV
jgi:hypothetical protein